MSIAAIESLVAAIERWPDAAARESARSLVRAVLELHREGLARMLDVARTSGVAGGALVDAFAREGAVSSLLLLHGLHPLDLEGRVREALERTHGVELVSIVDDVVRVRVDAGAVGPAAPARRAALEHAFGEAAPDAAGIVIEGLDGPPEGFVPIESVRTLGARPAVASGGAP